MEKIVVLKLGGHALKQKKCLSTLVENIKYLQSNGYKILIVHGGTPSINEKLQEKHINSQLVNGYRITTKEIMKIVEEAVLGEEVLGIVKILNKNGLNTMGLNGHDCQLMKCQKAILDDKIDYGFVGHIVNVNKDFLIGLLNMGVIPVISPIGHDDCGNSYNMNSDYVASEIAKSITADYLIMITNINGVYLDINDPMSRIKVLDSFKTNELINNGKILPTMATKVNACIDYTKKLNNESFIIDSNQKINDNLFSQYDFGTKIIPVENDYTIRLAHASDIKEIIKVVKKSFLKYQQHINYKIDPYKEKYEDVLRQLDENFIFVAIKNNTIVGSIRLKDMGNSIGRLYRICVLDEYQNCGIGSALVRYAENYAYQKGIVMIGLTTLYKVDYLDKFYQKNGYTIYDTDNKRNYTRSLMVKNLSKNGLDGKINTNLFM